jgi:hypothetical protein
MECQVYGGRWEAGDECASNYAVVVVQDLHAHLKGTSSIVHTTSQKAGSPMMSRPTISPQFWPECSQKSNISAPKPRESFHRVRNPFMPEIAERTKTFTSADLLRSSKSHRNSVKHGNFRVQERLGERSARLGLRKGTHSSSSIAARYGER